MAAFSLSLSDIRTPGWRRSVLLRRVLAAALVVGALISAARDAGAGDPRVLVFARPVTAGDSLVHEDVALLPVPGHLHADTALTDVDDAVGRIAAVDSAAGELVTGAKFVGSDLADVFVGEITTIVPVRPAEPEILPLLRHGDHVTILASTPEQTESEVIATGGRVILVDTRESPGTLLIAFPADTAHTVAAASLSTPLAVVLTADLPT